MKVFLCWSGNRSKAVAEGLGAWLAKVIQAVEPWISSGIEKGARWQSEIAERLDEAKVGIVCLTSGNLTAPWILFEAGALSKTKDSYVCTFLLDVTPTDVEPPLGQFQHTVFTKEDVLKLVRTINDSVKKSGERALTDEILTSMFDTFWPQLETQLTDIKNQPKPKTHPRPERQLLEEMLEILRSQEQRVVEQREMQELAATMSRMFGTTIPAEPNLGLRLYRDRLSAETSKKKAGDKKSSLLPTEPFKKEPSKAESREK